MRKANQIKSGVCMTCGTPVTRGLFCAKCIEAGSGVEEAKPEGWKGIRFSEDRKRRFEKQMLRDELTTWGRRLTYVVIIALVFFGGWKVFGDRIQTEFRQAADVVKPADRTDPTAKPVLDARGNPVGSTHFTGKLNR